MQVQTTLPRRGTSHLNGLGFWGQIATGANSLLNTGATLYQTKETTSAAKADSKAKIEAAKAALALAQTEMEQRQIAAELKMMEAANRREFIKDVAPIGLATLFVGSGLIYYLRKNKKKGRR